MNHRRRSAVLLILALVLVATCATASAELIGRDGWKPLLLVSPDGRVMIVGPDEVGELTARGWTQPTPDQRAGVEQALRRGAAAGYYGPEQPSSDGGGGGGGAVAPTPTTAPTTTTTTPPPAPTCPTAVAADDPSTFRVVALGDSQTSGDAIDPAEAWPHHLDALAAGALVVENAGVGGTSLTEGSGNTNPSPTMHARFMDLVASRPDVIVLLGGTNDLFLGVPTARIQATIDTLDACADAVGVELVVVTVPKFGSWRGVAERNPDIDTLNAWINGRGGRTVDLGAHVTDTDLLPDGVHINAATHQWLAAQVWALLD